MFCYRLRQSIKSRSDIYKYYQIKHKKNLLIRNYYTMSVPEI